MKVYVVIKHVHHEVNTILAVFNNLEEAKDFVFPFESQNEDVLVSYTIEEQEVL